MTLKEQALAAYHAQQEKKQAQDREKRRTDEWEVGGKLADELHQRLKICVMRSDIAFETFTDTDEDPDTFLVPFVTIDGLTFAYKSGKLQLAYWRDGVRGWRNFIAVRDMETLGEAIEFVQTLKPAYDAQL